MANDKAPIVTKNDGGKKNTFKNFWNSSEINNNVLNAIKRKDKEELIKLMKIHGLNANFNVNMENTCISILTLATMLGDGVVARWLLNKEADPNAADGSALEQAIATDNIELLHDLLKHGGNPNLGKGKLLLLAAKKNSLDAIETLVNHGAKIDEKIKQQLFDTARKNGNYDAMKLIADKLASVL